MRLISFEHNGQASFGAVIDGDRIVDLKPLLGGKADDLKSLLANNLQADAAAAVASATSFLSMDDVDLLPVIPNAGQNFCIGLNYGEHVRETGKEITETPVIFSIIYIGISQAVICFCIGVPLCLLIASRTEIFDREMLARRKIKKWVTVEKKKNRANP